MLVIKYYVPFSKIWCTNKKGHVNSISNRVCQERRIPLEQTELSSPIPIMLFYQCFCAGECIPNHSHVWHVLYFPFHRSNFAEAADGCVWSPQNNKYALFIVFHFWYIQMPFSLNFSIANHGWHSCRSCWDDSRRCATKPLEYTKSIDENGPSNSLQLHLPPPWLLNKM